VANEEYSGGMGLDPIGLPFRFALSPAGLAFSDWRFRIAPSSFLPIISDGFLLIEPHPYDGRTEDVVSTYAGESAGTLERSWAYLEASQEQVYGGYRGHGKDVSVPYVRVGYMRGQESMFELQDHVGYGPAVEHASFP
jgi:hypothetical protein